ncbi:MAG: hypothetical protein QXS59_03235, partial [Metallosphaera sp.]
MGKRILDAVLVFLAHVVRHRPPAPRLLLDVKLTDHERHEVGDVRLILFPVKRARAVAVVALFDQFAVAD